MQKMKKHGKERERKKQQKKIAQVPGKATFFRIIVFAG
jgi:hypothetical protein